MARPENLPEFEAPPLNEVVMGVQFNQIAGYGLINAGEVRNLFVHRYPKVEVRPATPPMFEAFGGVSPGSNGSFFQFDVGMAAGHPRFWFSMEDDTELLQFEASRLLHNWRQPPGVDATYPRYESLADRFREELEKLDAYSRSLSGEPLLITQAEISYINRLYRDENSEFWPLEDLAFLRWPVDQVELGGGAFQRVVSDELGPLARLYCEFGTAFDETGRAYLAFSQTFRGAPRSLGIGPTLEFLALGRHIVVESFAQLTSKEAHAKWRRSK